MSRHQVSIIIPVHNAGRFIYDTIQSVLAQTYHDYELILVDDGSVDSSAEIIGEFLDRGNIRLISLKESMGAALARNAGLEQAKGRFVCFLDADDLWEPEKLEEQLAFMKKGDYAFTFTGYEFADENGVSIDRIVRVPKRMTYKKALKNTTIFTSTVMFDTKKIPIGMINMPEVPSEDTATWWKILKEGYVAYGLNRPLTLYRRSGGTLSSNKAVAVKRIWNLYRNVEGLSVPYSAYCFVFYAIHAVWRRL
ncbi:MAG: glycosyltransferase [Lachnospiraceae bacterium]|nr:glycosyltransferase [Lachnospiraceae bacterium]